MWRTRYVKVYCRQRRVRLFVFADATSSMPVTYNINEKTSAEMVEKSGDDAHSSFVFRIFHQRRKHHVDDDASISDITHDDLDGGDDEDDDEEERGRNPRGLCHLPPSEI